MRDCGCAGARGAHRAGCKLRKGERWDVKPKVERLGSKPSEVQLKGRHAKVYLTKFILQCDEAKAWAKRLLDMIDD